MASTKVPGYEEAPFTAAGFTRTLYRRGRGPGVIVMHELPGLTPETIEFADAIADDGFHVVLPLFFGAPGRRTALGALGTPLLCLRREFTLFAAGRASAIVDWLLPLCRKVHADCGGRGIGVIGMCLTGGFVLSMMVDPVVLAAVAAQPSLPMFRPDALDVDDATLAKAVARADRAPLLTMRFEGDVICPAKRLDRLERAFGGAPRIRRLNVPGNGHATLTLHYGAAKARGVDTRREVLAHLRRQLRD